MQTIVRDASQRPTTHLLHHAPNSLSFPANLGRYHERAAPHGYGAVFQRGPSSSYHQLIVDPQYQPTYAPPPSDRNYYYGEQADNVGYYEARSPSPHMSLCRWCWTTICCCCPTWCFSADRGQRMPWSSFRRRSQDDKGRSLGASSSELLFASAQQRRHGNISEEVYQKIREVDQQTSTLTAAGVQGLSARVLNKYEYRQDLLDGTSEIHVCQLVEIIKKPGQSLGLYLREGNGVDRPSGVFASRFGDNSELQRYGDIVRPGDEILEVNNVQVSHMNIDDVVLILSIPRRLLLRVRFVKNRREPAWLSVEDADSSRSGRPDHSRPVVVFKKVGPAANNSNSVTPAISREDSHESGFGDEGQGPTPTAKTSLGKRARQQLVEMQQLQQGPTTSSTNAVNATMSAATMPRPGVRSIDIQQQPSTSTAAPPNAANYAPSPSMSRATRTLSPRETFALHQPRLLDSHGQPMLDHDTVSRTARVPPPKLYGTVRRAESFNPTISMAQSAVGTLSRSSTHAAPSSSMFSPRSVASDSLMDYQRTFQPPQLPPPPLNPYATNPRGPAPPVPPKPAIRRPIGSASVYERQMQMNAYKSNSLPRRRPTAATRTVKWRNDVTGEGVAVVPTPPDMSTDSDGAISAPEFAMSPTYGGAYATLRGYRGHNTMRPFIGNQLAQGRTIDDIFSAQEYRNWAGGVYDPFRPIPVLPQQRHSRWSHTYGDGARYGSEARSSSLPPRGVLSQFGASPLSTPPMGQRYTTAPSAATIVAQQLQQQQPIYSNFVPMRASDQSVYDRLHVSPLMNRRIPAPLRAAGPGFNVDEEVRIPPRPAQNSTVLTAMTGLLIVHILEGRGLKIPEKQKTFTDEMYCVLEVNEVHRARTGVSTAQQRFRWQETFEIDVCNARDTDFFVYSWHPQYRHKLCHKGSLKLLEAFIVDRLNGDRTFALNLEPRGQLLVRIGFHNVATVFRRAPSVRINAYFGIDLNVLVDREQSGYEVPIVLRRLIDEIERRGVDSAGIYTLCGSTEKKRALRIELERSPSAADLSADAVPDTNVLTSILKDFLRELPEPLIPGCIYQMLVDAAGVSLPNDRAGNARLVLGVLDCIPRVGKCTLMVLMDHFKAVSASEPHNGLHTKRMATMFGPMLLCTSHPRQEMTADIAASAAAAGLPRCFGQEAEKSKRIDFLNVQTAADTFAMLLDLWPGRVSSSDSSGSENSTIILTNNGALSLVDVWSDENALRTRRYAESNC